MNRRQAQNRDKLEALIENVKQLQEKQATLSMTTDWPDTHPDMINVRVDLGHAEEKMARVAKALGFFQEKYIENDVDETVFYFKADGNPEVVKHVEAWLEKQYERGGPISRVISCIGFRLCLIFIGIAATAAMIGILPFSIVSSLVNRKV